MSFGYSYMIDLYNCKKGACDDLEMHYRFLEELVWRLGMDKMSAPVVIHAPVKFDINGNRLEIYEDKAGVSCWCPLIQSGIQGHSLEPARFSSWDIYSCKIFDIETVKQICKKYFNHKSEEDNYIIRGKKYLCNQ